MRKSRVDVDTTVDTDLAIVGVIHGFSPHWAVSGDVPQPSRSDGDNCWKCHRTTRWRREAQVCDLPPAPEENSEASLTQH